MSTIGDVGREETWLFTLLVLLGLGGIGGICYAIWLEAAHPCLKYETHWDSFHIIGYDSKANPVYGPGEVRECTERQP